LADVTPPAAGGLGRLLVAVDGTEFSTGAVQVASDLARISGAMLVVLTVLPVRQGSDVMGIDTRIAEQEDAKNMVRGPVAVAQAGGVKTLAATHRGRSPAQGIVAAANEHRADLIVMGRRGRYSLARAVLGSAVARVIAGAPQPVLVVPRAAKMWERRILLASDGSPPSEMAARSAAVLARIHKLPLTVLSVEVPKHSPERQAEAARIVERLVASLRAEGLEAEGRVAKGMPPDAILAVAGEVGADLIVMGSKGRTPLERALLGSNSRAVIGRAACPVLVATTAALGTGNGRTAEAPAMAWPSQGGLP